VIFESNRHLVFTVRAGTDLQITPWIGLWIATVSGPYWTQIRISRNGSGSHRTGPDRCTCNPNIPVDIQTHTYTLYTYPYMHTHTCTYIITHTHMQTYYKHTHAYTHTHL